jgi:hypothetical protein
MSPGIATFSITIQNMTTLSNQCHYAVPYFYTFMLGVVMLSVIMLRVVMLSVVMLSVVMLSVTLLSVVAHLKEVTSVN